MDVGIFRRFAAALLGPRRGFLEQRQLRRICLLEVVGIDRLRLDCRIDAGAPGRVAGVHRLLKVAGMVMAPSGEH